MEDVLTAIGTVGFPIVMALVEAYYIATRSDKMTDIVNENTQAIKELKQFLDDNIDNGGDSDGK